MHFLSIRNHVLSIVTSLWEKKTSFCDQYSFLLKKTWQFSSCETLKIKADLYSHILNEFPSFSSVNLSIFSSVRVGLYGKHTPGHDARPIESRPTLQFRVNVHRNKCSWNCSLNRMKGIWMQHLTRIWRNSSRLYFDIVSALDKNIVDMFKLLKHIFSNEIDNCHTVGNTIMPTQTQPIGGRLSY